MNINVTTTKVSIDNESLNKGEYNVRECNFNLAEEYEGLVCKALFTVIKTKLTYEQSIVNGKCSIPYEATVNRGKVIVGVIGYEVNDEELVKRYSPEPDEFFVLDGSYIEDIENQSTPTPSELEQLEQRVASIELDAEQVETNTQDISDIKSEQITQNENIQTNAGNISTLQGKVETNENDIGDIKQEQTTQNANITNLQTNKADKSEIPDVSDFITKDVNDLTNYTLTTETGSQIELSLNSSNFKMTATLKDKNGNTVDTSNEIDLPLESVVVNASYDSTTKEIVLTLQNGNTVRFSVADLVSGLVSDTDYATLSKGGVIKLGNTFGIAPNGAAAAGSKTYTEYQRLTNYDFIGKGTLENVIAGKQLINKTKLDESQATQDTTIEALQAENTKLKQQIAQDRATYPTTTGSGENITLSKTAEMEFIQPPLPRGNSEQVQYSGKNKFGISSNFPITKNGLTFTKNDDGTITINGTASTTFSQSFTLFNQLLNGSYVIKHNVISGTVSANCYMSIQDSDNNNISDRNYGGTGSGSLSLENITIISASLYITSGTVFNNYTVGSQLEQGSTATDYEPYVGGTASPNPQFPSSISNVTGDVEVLLQNKNLFELLDLVKLSDEYSQSGNGYTFSSKQSMYSTGVELDKPLELPISFSYKIKNGTGQNFRLRFWFDDGTVQAMNAYSSGTSTSEVLITANNITKTGATKITKIGADFAGQYTTFTITDFIINSGTTATSYVPHKEQTYTFPLGTQRMYLGDYLADDGIHHVRKQVVFDGSSDESWSYYSNGGVTNRRFIITISNMKIGTTGNQYLVLCNRFKQGSNDINDNFLYALANYNNIWVGSTQLETLDVAGFKAWLSTHNVTVEYELTEEEITPYTTEQQQAYNEIKQALSYEEQTNISGSSDESNPILSVEAYQSLKLVLAS